MKRHRGPCCECLSFKAATWNVFHGTHVDELAPILDKLLADDVSILLMQEAGGRDIKELIESRGLRYYLAQPQYVIAWNPERWHANARETIKGRQLFYAAGSKHGRTSDAALVELDDKLVIGQHVSTLSYHTPAHVQTSDQPARRLLALRESVGIWRDLAKSRDVCLFGGDDNVDEARGSFGPWDFMRRAATGLTQITAPEATHGRKRKIDDFRVKGLRAHEAYVADGGGDHKLHVRRFSYR